MCVGLGLLMGPLIGSILFNIGGYSMPFAAMALTYVIMVPIVISSLRAAADEHRRQAKETSQMDTVTALS